MELHERIANSTAGPALHGKNRNGDGHAPDPFAELKNRIHLALVSARGIARSLPTSTSGARPSSCSTSSWVIPTL